MFGLSFDAFESQWKNFLKNKGLKPIEGSRVRKLRVKKEGREDEEGVELREIQSNVARNRTHLGDQLLGRGRTVAAANEYQRALQISPHSPIILNKLGRAFIQLNRLDDARDSLKKALDIDPDGANTYVQLGRIYHTGKKYRESIGALEEAVQINPFNPLIYRLLAEGYAALGETQKAQTARSNLDKLMGAN
jgi:predicted Zn-dependent protease